MDNKKNIISFLNMKGGVGKTTLCKEIAMYLSSNNKKVLVIDIDPQSNCTQSFFERFDIINLNEDNMIEKKDNLPSIDNLLSQSNTKLYEIKLVDVILELTDKLHLIPGDLDTVFIERETGTGANENKLVNFIEEFKLKDQYDYIFIDCPPTYSFYTVSALKSSDFYFVPLKPDAYSLLGLDLLERVIDDLRKTYRTAFKNKPLYNLGVIFTMVGGSALKGMGKNILDTKNAFKDSDIYFFKNNFPKIEKLATVKLSKFIIDREDGNLLKNLKEICKEFEERIDYHNEC